MDRLLRGVSQGTWVFDRDCGWVRRGLEYFLVFVSHLISLPCATIESRGAQAGLFPIVSSAFIFDIQSKLEPDPNGPLLPTHAVYNPRRERFTLSPCRPQLRRLNRTSRTRHHPIYTLHDSRGLVSRDV